MKFDLNRSLVSVEKLLARLRLPAGPDELINHKTILGLVLGMVGAMVGWALTEPYQEDFSFWRDFAILATVGCFVWLFVSSLDNIFEKSLRAILVGLKRTFYVPFLIVAAVMLSKIAVVVLSGIGSLPAAFAGSPEKCLKVFVLDISGSMQGHSLDTLKKAVKTYVESLEKNSSRDLVVSVACVTFADDAKVVQAPTTDYKAFLAKVDNIQAAGQTNMAAGLDMAQTIVKPVLSEAGDLAPKRKSLDEIFLVSDGMPNLPIRQDNKKLPFEALEKSLVFFESNKIPINSIGAGDEYVRPLMENIAAKTNGKFAPADNVDDLVPVFEQFAQAGLAQAKTGNRSALPFGWRVAGWIVVGLVIGVGSALSRRSRRAIFMGIIGGALGGALGALCFEGFQLVVGRLNVASGVFNRLGGFMLLGSCVGFCVPFVESAGKTAWLRITQGLGEGRLIILDRSPMILGRHELIDIPIFGDPQIDLRNLRLEKKGKNLYIESLGPDNLMIRDAKARKGTLAHQDTFAVGNTRFLYLNRREAVLSTKAALREAFQDRIPDKMPKRRAAANDASIPQVPRAKRRLPIYLLLDVSDTMRGKPIDAINRGLIYLEAALKNDSYCSEFAHISVIPFGSEAERSVSLTSVGVFRAPVLTASGRTSLGNGLSILSQSLRNEVKRKSADHLGDWKPIIFLIINGQPTDSWEGTAEDLRACIAEISANVIAIASSREVTAGTLRQIGRVALVMDDTSPQAIKDLFGWITESAKVASRSASYQAAAGENSGGAKLPSPPSGIRMAE